MFPKINVFVSECTGRGPKAKVGHSSTPQRCTRCHPRLRSDFTPPILHNSDGSLAHYRALPPKHTMDASST
eukprot:6269529-Amphidinium_carterae.2